MELESRDFGQEELAAGPDTLTTNAPAARRRGSSRAVERGSIFARISEDARSGAEEYVDRWVAGRGAE